MFFYLCLIVIVLTLPGTLELVFLTVMAWFGKAESATLSDASKIRLAVVVPAHNEESGLADTLQSILLAENPPDNKDIVVIADNCDDDTESIANHFGVTVLVRNDKINRGKGYALNYAFSSLLNHDSHDGFVVVDADTYVDRNLFDEFRALFYSGGQAGQALYKVKNPEASIRTRLMNISFLAFDLLRPLARNNAGISVGILGNGFGLSRDTISDVPYNSFSIVEDLEYHLRLIDAGKTVSLIGNAAVWSDMPVGGAEAKSQRERWEGGRFIVCRQLVPRLLADVFVRHRREFIEPLFELLLLPLAFHLALILPLLLSSNIIIKVYAEFSLMIVVVHVLSAMILGKANRFDYLALASVPFYVLWKLINIKGILRTAIKGAEWKRTGR